MTDLKALRRCSGRAGEKGKKSENGGKVNKKIKY
jgi:hypothetical protein